MTTLVKATTALVLAASGVDKAIGSSERAKAAWSGVCAMGLVGNKPSLTLDLIGSELVNACLRVATKAQAKHIATPASLSRNGFPTAYGWFRDLVRVHEAGLCKYLLPSCTDNGGKPFSLTELRRGTDPVQPKRARKAKKVATPKGGKLNQTVEQPAKVATPAATITFTDVRKFLVAMRKQGKVEMLAKHQADISVILAESGNIARMIETAARVAREAKAAKKTAKVRVRKAA